MTRDLWPAFTLALVMGIGLLMGCACLRPALHPAGDRAFIPSGPNPQAVSSVPVSIPSAGDR